MDRFCGLSAKSKTEQKLDPDPLDQCSFSLHHAGPQERKTEGVLYTFRKGDVWFPSSGSFPVEGSGLWAQGHHVCCVCTCSMRFELFPQATVYVLMFPADVFPLFRKNVWEEYNADTVLPRGIIYPQTQACSAL